MNELLQYAKFYHKLGFNVTCNQRETNVFFPAHNEMTSLIECHDLSKLESYDWKNATTIGAVIGNSINNVEDESEDKSPYIAIGIENCVNYSVVHEILQLLWLPENYAWVIEYGRNYYIIIQCNPSAYEEIKDWGVHWQDSPNNPSYFSFLANKDYSHLFETLFIIWKGHILLPPSWDSSNRLYSFINKKLPEGRPNYYWSLEDSKKDWEVTGGYYFGSSVQISHHNILEILKTITNYGEIK